LWLDEIGESITCRADDVLAKDNRAMGMTYWLEKAEAEIQGASPHRP
jgi:hypothetical protein